MASFKIRPVPKILTMISQSLDMAKKMESNFGSLETLGENSGVRMASLELLEDRITL